MAIQLQQKRHRHKTTSARKQRQEDVGNETSARRPRQETTTRRQCDIRPQWFYIEREISQRGRHPARRPAGPRGSIFLTSHPHTHTPRPVFKPAICSGPPRAYAPGVMTTVIMTLRNVNEKRTALVAASPSTYTARAKTINFLMSPGCEALALHLRNSTTES